MYQQNFIYMNLKKKNNDIVYKFTIKMSDINSHFKKSNLFY